MNYQDVFEKWVRGGYDLLDEEEQELLDDNELEVDGSVGYGLPNTDSDTQYFFDVINKSIETHDIDPTIIHTEGDGPLPIPSVKDEYREIDTGLLRSNKIMISSEVLNDEIINITSIIFKMAAERLARTIDDSVQEEYKSVDDPQSITLRPTDQVIVTRGEEFEEEGFVQVPFEFYAKYGFEVV